MRIWTNTREEEQMHWQQRGKREFWRVSRLRRMKRKAGSQVFGQHGNHVVVEGDIRIDSMS